MTARQIVSLIKQIHASELPEILSAIVVECAHKKVFKDRPLGEIVAALEKAALGK